MSAAEYRRRAAEINAAAKLAATPQKRIEMEHLARSYLRLATQAERNAGNDLVYGSILPPRDNDAEPGEG